jgi:hypothetical protein
VIADPVQNGELSKLGFIINREMKNGNEKQQHVKRIFPSM